MVRQCPRVFGFFNQLQIQQSLNRRVQRARAHTKLSAGDFTDTLHDRVSVLLATREREKDKNAGVGGNRRGSSSGMRWSAVGRFYIGNRYITN